MSADERAFVWPPEPDGLDTTGAVDAGAHALPGAEKQEENGAGRSADRAPWWRSVERAWLEPTRLPLRTRAERLGWSPDAHEVYCARCGHGVGPHEETEFGCSTCAGSRFVWSRVVRLGAYAEPLSSWVQEVKFERGWRLGEALGERLGGRLLDCGLERGGAVVVPMPTTWRRRMARGTDHALTISRGVRRATGCPLVRLLGRRHALSQRSVKYWQRASNVSGVFRVRPRALERVEGRPIVLVDDVSTSGATLRAAARAIASAKGRGRSVVLWVGVLAVTPPGGAASGPGARRGSEQASGRPEEGFGGPSGGRVGGMEREDGDFLQASS